MRVIVWVKPKQGGSYQAIVIGEIAVTPPVL
jgi:hypothetical protein